MTGHLMAACNLVLALLQAPATKGTLRLYAVGDINLGRRTARERLIQGDTLYSFRPLLDTLRGADITFGNLESPIAATPAPYAFYRPPGANSVAWGDTAWLFPAIRSVKQGGRADLVVVSVHGGREFVAAPPSYHTDLLYGLVDAGADVVLAHHPHVLQPVLRYKGKPIVQSLGNFIFLQSEPWTRLSAILRVVVRPDKRIRLSAIPVRVGHQATLASGAAADSVRRRLGIPLSTQTHP